MTSLLFQVPKKELYERQDIYKAATTKGQLLSKVIRQKNTGPNKGRGNV